MEVLASHEIRLSDAAPTAVWQTASGYFGQIRITNPLDTTNWELALVAATWW